MASTGGMRGGWVMRKWSLAWVLLVPQLGATGSAGPISVKVDPETATVRIGATKHFASCVLNSPNQNVTWTVNGFVGGNARWGTISSSGLYTPPTKLPIPNKATIRAIAAVDPAKFIDVPVILHNPVPAIGSLSPAQVSGGVPFSILVNGSGYIERSKAMWNGAPIETVYVASNQLRITGTTSAAAGTMINVTVVNPDPGGSTSNAKGVTVTGPVTISVTPETRTIRGGTLYDFNATISNSANRAVAWYVNDIRGGDAAVGTIDDNGLYSAPMLLPGPAVTIKGASAADPRAVDTALVTLLNPVPSISTVTPGAVTIGPFSITLNGSGFAPTATVLLSRVPLRATWISHTQMLATGDAVATAAGLGTITVANPDPGPATSSPAFVSIRPVREIVSRAAAARFLDQAAWGADPQSLARLQEIGVNAWLDEQFLLPPSSYPDPVDENQSLSAGQRAFLYNAFTGSDQLRQRVAFALGQILVVSGSRLGRYHQMVGYQRLLAQHAFGNYFDLMRDVSLSPAMGVFLDMVNNDKPDAARNIVPNENYARELMQLFTIGLFELNADGTRRLDSAGGPIPAYSEDTVKEMALAMTGWTYPARPGFQSRWRNQAYFFGPMEPFDEHHDMTEKTLLNGVVLPAGRGAREDLDAALRNLFAHPNVGPFVAYRLIQRLVTSNPSPAYVGRVATVFNDNGAGSRGDLKAVVRAILLDPEAGNAGALAGAGAPATVLPSNQGHLREPVLFGLSVLRALGATVTPELSLTGAIDPMGQRLLYPPSVFNYFSPSYRIPGIGVVAPEFQIMNPQTALARVNFVYRGVRNLISSTITVDLSGFEALAPNPGTLVDAVSNALARGELSPEMRASILRAIGTTTDNRLRSRNAIYLVATSSQYQVQR